MSISSDGCTILSHRYRITKLDSKVNKQGICGGRVGVKKRREQYLCLPLGYYPLSQLRVDEIGRLRW